MKKIIFFLLSFIFVQTAVFAQTPCTSDRDYDFGVKNGLKMAPKCSDMQNTAQPSANQADSESCKSAKIKSFSATERYSLSLLQGYRGFSVPGYQEAEAAAQAVRKICGYTKYDAHDLMADGRKYRAK